MSIHISLIIQLVVVNKLLRGILDSFISVVNWYGGLAWYWLKELFGKKPNIGPGVVLSNNGVVFDGAVKGVTLLESITGFALSDMFSALKNGVVFKFGAEVAHGAGVVVIGALVVGVVAVVKSGLGEVRRVLVCGGH